MLWVVGVLVSVLLTFFSFPPFGLGGIMFIGLVPLFLAMETAPTWKSAFGRTWLYVFLGNSAICFWVAHSMHHFARLPWILSYPCVGLLSLVEQSAWPVMAALRHILHRHFGWRPLLWTPACLMVLDFAWPKFFPNTMGNVFYQIPWLAQLADFTGVWGLTALMVMTNELIAVLLLRQWPKAQLKRHALVSVGVFIAALSYAGWRHGQIKAVMAAPTGTFRVAVIQPNFNAVATVRTERDKHAARLRLLAPLLEMSKKAATASPDLIFWPETAVSNTYHSDDPNETAAVTVAIDRFVNETKIPLLFGARDRAGLKLYNALFFLLPSAGEQPMIDRYHKHLLLWLGEYIPFSGFFPSLADYIQKQGGTAFTAGPGPKVFSHPKVKFAPMICLEGLYSGYVRKLGLTDVDLLVNATNDAWFGPGMEPALHLYLTAFRAIETRRPLVRSTTTGHSTVVDIDGSLRWKTELNESAIKIDDVPLYPRLISPYQFLGNTVIWMAGLWAALPLLILLRRKHYHA